MHKSWALRQLLYQAVLEELDRHFSLIQVKYMPIKGAFLIASGLSEKISNRKMVDIDILVPPTDLEKTVQHFEKQPCFSAHTDKWHFEKPFLFQLGKQVVHIEFHSRLNREERFYLPTEELFERSKEYTRFCRLPDIHDALLITVCHFLVHITYFRIPDILQDVQIITQDKSFSWPVFWERSHTTGIYAFTVVVVNICKEGLDPHIALPTPGFYSRCIALPFLTHAYAHAPRWLRRVVLEIPYVKNAPALLMAKKNDI